MIRRPRWRKPRVLKRFPDGEHFLMLLDDNRGVGIGHIVAGMPVSLMPPGLTFEHVSGVLPFPKKKTSKKEIRNESIED